MLVQKQQQSVPLQPSEHFEFGSAEISAEAAGLLREVEPGKRGPVELVVVVKVGLGAVGGVGVELAEAVVVVEWVGLGVEAVGEERDQSWW